MLHGLCGPLGIRLTAALARQARPLATEARARPLSQRLGSLSKVCALGVGTLSAVAVGQAVYLRLSYDSPVDPEGSVDGQAGQGLAGEPMKVLFVGDSVAVGVGAARAAPLQAGFASRLSQLQGRPVGWKTVGGTGVDSRGLRSMLACDAEAERFDAAVVLCGVNDGKKLLEGRWPAVFRADLESLCVEVRRRVPEGAILVPRIPGYMRAPELQLWPMRYFVRLFFKPYDDQKRCVAEAMGLDSPIPRLEELPSSEDTHLWACDGMHPSAEGYRIVGEWLAAECHESSTASVKCAAGG